MNYVTKSENLAYAPVASATVIAVGDNLYYDQSTNTVKPAADYTYSNLADAQANFVRDFVGVACTASASGETDDVLFDYGSEVEFGCSAAQFGIGDILVPADNTTALHSQTIVAGGHPAGLTQGIARVTRAETANNTRVRARITPAWCNPQSPYWITLYEGNLGTSAIDLVTDMAIHVPMQVLVLRVISTVVADADVVIAMHNGANALDDTVTVATSGSAIGKVTEAAINDANNYDIFDAGDTLSIASDGGLTSTGSGVVMALVAPLRAER